MEGVHITRSRRKSIELSIDDNLQIAVKAPLWVTDRAIDHFIAQKADWISRQKAAKAAYLQAHPPLTEAEVEALRRRAKAELPPRVAYYSQILGVTPTGIKITSAKKRFGSCNGKNSICFSLSLMQYPQAAIDYVVVHELCHIRHHDHSPAFYRLVESVLPDYKKREHLLRR